MADLQRLQDFAAANNFGLTNPLRHEQVVRFAEFWMPVIKFYEDERFHPIELDEVFSMVDSTFGALPAAAQDTWRLRLLVRHPTILAGTFRRFDPPAVYFPEPFHGPDGIIPAVRVLASGTSAKDALAAPETGSSTRVSHGASFARSNQFFGPLTTVSGTNTSSPGDPFLPRATEPDPNQPSETRPRITVMAALHNLVELLKYDLTVAGASDYPPDGMRGSFDIIGSLLRKFVPEGPDLTSAQQRELLLGHIASHESGGTIPPPEMPFGWRIDRLAWDVLTRFTFLEFTFFYAYNDFERYQTAIFDNEHEGDDEGCCLVFDRNSINLAAADDDPSTLLRVIPHSIITSVHEEYMGGDCFRFVPSPIPDPNNPAPLAREVVDFTVFVAGGSHATYLTPGDHDLVDFGDYFAWVEEKIPILLILFPVVLVIAIILHIFEHFLDTEDYTSENGIHTGPPELVAGDPLAVALRTLVLPMSADNHIYLPANEELLRLRAFAGKWGGHTGPVDVSPPFKSKSGRYFRKLLKEL